MPSRVIRGCFLSSESMARVSIPANLMFANLILGADDFGRTDARPRALRALLYSMRDDIAVDDVAKWLDELTSGDDPPVHVYKFDGKTYLHLVNFEKHRGKAKRGVNSRWPAPTCSNCSEGDESPDSPRGSAGILGDPRVPARGGEVAGWRGDEVTGRSTRCRSSNEPRPDSAPKGKANAKTPKPPPIAWARWIAGVLAQHVRWHYPSARITTASLVSWAGEISRIDAPPEQILRVVNWLYGPNREAECSIAVRSGRTLRSKWQSGQIEDAVQRLNSSQSRKAKPNKLDRIAEHVRKFNEGSHETTNATEKPSRQRSGEQELGNALRDYTLR